MSGCGRFTKARAIARRTLAVFAFLALAACAAPEDEDSERFVLFEQPESIDLAETDLTLPLNSPLEISAVRERVGEGQVFENLYSFHHVKGFIRTSRVVFGHFSNNVSNELRGEAAFRRFVGDLSLPPADRDDLRTLLQSASVKAAARRCAPFSISSSGTAA